MLKKIQHTILAAAIALAPAGTASAMYEKICLDQGAAGYVASFVATFMQRDNPNNLDPRRPARQEKSHDAIGRVHAHEHRCFDPADIGAQPGDRIKFKVRAHGGNTVDCNPSGREAETHEGFWLMPDGPRQGVLTFGEGGGTTLHHRCGKNSGELRMHSECNATLDGMSNAGCAYFHPTITDSVLHDIVGRRLGYGMLGSALHRGADINKAPVHPHYGNHNAALHIAAWTGYADYAELLVESDANINARNAEGFTPLMLAADRNHADLNTMEALLDGNANPNYAAFSGVFPLYQAALHNNVDMARLLVENGARINALNAGNGESSLVAAKRANNQEVLDYLRGIGAREGVYDRIVYDIVAEDRGARRLRDALNGGADVNFPGDNGQTALHVAAGSDLRNYVAELTKSSQLDIDRLDNEGRTALLTALQSEDPSASVVRSLISNGADANTAGADGRFPLYAVVQSGRQDLLQLLAFARGLDLNQRHADSELTALGLSRQLVADDPDRFNGIVKFLERRRAKE